MTAHEPRPGSHDCQGNAAPYVLGALTDDEHHAFSRHLQSCAVCREEVAALQLVASTLPHAAPHLSAPPALKQRVMASVREDARLRHGEPADAVSAPARPRAGRHAAHARRAHGPARSRASSSPPILAVGALALAALLALAVLVISGSLSGSRGSHGGGAPARVIQAQVVYPHASASLRVTRDAHAQLDLVRMPQSSPGRVYQLWIKRSPTGRPLPTRALFTVAADGAAEIGVPGSVRGVREIMVTSEPLGGSRVPTLPALVVARLS